MAELAASNTGGQAEVADTDGIILEGIGKVIATLGHSTDKDANALFRLELLDVVSDADDGGIETQGDLAAVGRQVIGDGVLDDLEQLLLRRSRSNGEAVQELNHETGETLEGSGDADGGADFDEDTFGGGDVDLEFAGLVDGGVEKGEKTL